MYKLKDYELKYVTGGVCICYIGNIETYRDNKIVNSKVCANRCCYVLPVRFRNPIVSNFWETDRGASGRCLKRVALDRVEELTQKITSLNIAARSYL